jgi:MYXO-CTERM domain-containing protein
VIDGEADLAVTLQSASSVESGKALSATFAASNATSIDTVTVAVEFTLSAGIVADSAQIAGGDCVVQPQSVRCTVPTIAAKSSVKGMIGLTGASVGPATLQARISSTYTDPTAGNDSITQKIDVTAPPSSPSSNTGGGGGGGGGGSTSALWILSLAAFLGIRRRQAAATRPVP